MQFADVVACTRKLYVGHLITAVESAVEPFVEPVFRMADGSLAVEGPLSLPLRADLIPRLNGAPGEPVSVNSDRILSFAPFTVDVQGVEVEIHPFHWDAVNLEVTSSSPPDLGALRNWFFAWFDPDDSRQCDAGGVYGVVHFMSDPNVVENRMSFQVDLGSAPEGAFLGLIEALADIGSLRVVVG